jgi:predicted DNA-binding transcriptional regulator AlpA
MSSSPANPKLHIFQEPNGQPSQHERFEVHGRSAGRSLQRGAQVLPEAQPDPLFTVEDVASRLNVTKDWVWDHSSRKHPYLPVIRMSDGTLRYRASKIEEFIDEREQLTRMRRNRAKMKRPNCSPAEIEE